MYNIIFITGKLNYCDGVSSHLFNLAVELNKYKNVSLMILCSGGDSIERFRESDIPVLENDIFDHNNRSLKNFSVAVKKLIRIIRQKKINIVHSHNHYAANIAYYADKFTVAKTVQTIHGIIPEDGVLKHFRADKYITVSETMKSFLIKNKIGNGNNIKSINHGFKYNGSTDKHAEEIQIICASRLVYEKGIDLFIKAAKIVKSKFPGNIKFLIAGKGECENELKILAKKINADVVFLGEIQNLPELFSQTNIFAMPTRSSEGFPMTIVEAALTKNFIITSEFNSLENIFKNNIDGFTFKADNYTELAEKIIEALSNTERTGKMVNAFFNKAKNIFDPGKMAESHIEVYKECLEA